MSRVEDYLPIMQWPYGPFRVSAKLAGLREDSAGAQVETERASCSVACVQACPTNSGLQGTGICQLKTIWYYSCWGHTITVAAAADLDSTTGTCLTLRSPQTLHKREGCGNSAELESGRVWHLPQRIVSPAILQLNVRSSITCRPF